MRRQSALAAWMIGALLAPVGCDRPRAVAPDVLLITVDTLRADHLGAYGDRQVDTPNLDRLAAEGTVYENAAAPMPVTVPSHASIFTSLYPRTTGVLNNGISLPESALTLAEILAERGWVAAAFGGVKILGGESGLLQGFGATVFPEASRELRADAVVDAARAWLATADPGAPIFVWVHLFDPHLPYAPPEPWRSRHALRGDLPDLDWPVLEELARRNGGDVPAAILDHARRLYRAEVEFVDQQVGVLLDALAERRPGRRQIAVMTADHGECFEKGVFFEHTDCLWQEALHVPLIVRDSAQPGGDRVAGQASLIDVAPTLLARLGLPIPTGFAGIDLAGAGTAERAVLVQHPVYRSDQARGRIARREVIASVGGARVARVEVGEDLAGLVSGRWKYLRPAGGEGALYELAPASSEPDAVGARHPEQAARLDAQLSQALARHPLNLAAPERLNPEFLEALRALGYLR